MRDVDSIDIAVGARLRLLRQARGLTMAALGEILGVTHQQVQKYELGRSRITASVLARAAAALGASVAELFAEFSPADDGLGEVAFLLNRSGALELLRAYASLPTAEQQRSVLALLPDLASPAEADLKHD